MIELNQPFWAHLGLALAHFVWQGAAVALLLWITLLLLRHRSPNARYLSATTALLVMVACPVVTWMYSAEPAAVVVAAVPPAGQDFPPKAIYESGKGQSPSTNSGHSRNSAMGTGPEIVMGTAPETVMGTVPGHSVMGTVPSENPVMGIVSEEPQVSESLPTVLARWWQDSAWRQQVLARGLAFLAACWAFGVTLLAVRLLAGWVSLRGWRRDSQSTLPEPMAGLVARLSQTLGLTGRVEVRLSGRSPHPLAFGLLRPMVLLPASAVMQCPAELLEAMIAHELAHIRRYDLWLNVLQRVIETLLFYHPAVWWVSGKMRLEREMCCDDLAVRTTGRRVEYAEALVTLARSARPEAALALGAGMFGARGALSRRVRQVLQLPSPLERTRTWAAGPITLGLCVLVVLGLARLQAGAERPALAAEVNAASQPAPAGAAPKVRCDRAVYEFSETWSGEKIAHAFVLANDGDAPLEILAVRPTCGCTVAGEYDKTIAPGAQGRIPVVLSTARMRGPIQKSINVETNDPRTRLLTLTIKGNVRPRITVDPPNAFWGADSPDTPASKKLAVTNRTDAPMKLAYVPETQSAGAANLSGFDVQVTEKVPGKEAEVTVTLKEPVREGSQGGQLRFQTGIPEEPELFIPVSRRVGGGAGGGMTGVGRGVIMGGGGGVGMMGGEGRSLTTGGGGGMGMMGGAVGGGMGGMMGGGGESANANLPELRVGSLPTPVPQRYIPVRSLSDGIIAEVKVHPGQPVKKGDVLVRLDAQEIQLELKAAEIRARSARELLRGAEAGVEPVPLRRTESELAELELDRWKMRLERTFITSPIDGMIVPANRPPPRMFDPLAMVGKKVIAGEELMAIVAELPMPPGATQPASGVSRMPPSGGGVYCVMGRVQRPGTYALPPGTTITLLQAIAAAGGPEKSLQSISIEISRKNLQGRQTVKQMEWSAIAPKALMDVMAMNPESALELEPDDVITVGVSTTPPSSAGGGRAQ